MKRETVDNFTEALLSGDDVKASDIVFGLLSDRQVVPEVCDLLVAPVLRELGKRWESGSAHVYQERIAAGLCLRLLWDMGNELDRNEADGPIAIGCSPEKDPYTIPTKMAELVLRSAGWKATSFGDNLPIWSLSEAVKTMRPDLCWISVSYLYDEEEFVRLVRELQAAPDNGRKQRVILGGRALNANLRGKIEDVVVLDDMRSLHEFQGTFRGKP